jgi:hypothetical protein
MDIWVARDSDGSVYLYQNKPDWMRHEPEKDEGEFMPFAGWHLSTRRGRFPEVKPGECRKATISLVAVD